MENVQYLGINWPWLLGTASAFHAYPSRHDTHQKQKCSAFSPKWTCPKMRNQPLKSSLSHSRPNHQIHEKIIWRINPFMAFRHRVAAHKSIFPRHERSPLGIGIIAPGMRDERITVTQTSAPAIPVASKWCPLGWRFHLRVS
jgi:hypothetical protein